MGQREESIGRTKKEGIWRRIDERVHHILQGCKQDPDDHV